MAVAAQLVAKVSAEGVPQTKQALSEVSQSVEKTSGGFKSMLGNALSFAAGQFAFNAVGNAVGFLKDQFVGAIQESMDAQAGMAQTVAVLKSTHDASGMTANAVADLAGNLSHLTMFSDDTIQSAENMLLTFTNIGKNVFPQATKTVLDMSQALGQDTKSSAIQLGKALNDPITGITALQRVGVTFTDSQKKLIQSMMDSGNVAGAQKVILQELNREFGNSAEAAGKTFPGQLAILKQRFSDVKQQIGDALIPVLSNLLGIVNDRIMPVLGKFGDWFGSTIMPKIQQFGSFLSANLLPVFQRIGGFVEQNVFPIFKQLGDMFANLGKGGNNSFLSSLVSGFQQVAGIVGGQFSQNFKMVQGILQDLGRWWQSTMQPAIAQAMPAFQRLGTIMATTVAPAIAKVWAVGQQLMREVMPPLIKAFETIAPIVMKVAGIVADNLGKAIQFLSPYIVQATQTIGKFASEIISRVIPIVQQIWSQIKAGIDWLLPLWNAVWPSIQQIFKGVWEAIKGTVQMVWSIVSGIIKTGLDLVRGDWKSVWNDIKGIFSGVWAGIQSIAQGTWDALSGIIRGGINLVIGLINNFIRGLDSIHIDIGDVHVGVNIPTIPYLASGIENFGGGLAYVHAGEVLTYLPPGTSVTPASQVRSLANSQPIVVNAVLEVDGRLMSLALLPHMTNAIRHNTGIWRA